jgi:hypothetical protein
MLVGGLRNIGPSGCLPLGFLGLNVHHAKGKESNQNRRKKPSHVIPPIKVKEINMLFHIFVQHLHKLNFSERFTDACGKAVLCRIRHDGVICITACDENGRFGT